MERTAKKFDIKKFASENSIWLVLIVMVVIMTIVRPAFLSAANLKGLLEGESIKGILAFGVMFPILAKGIDLSMGSVVAFIGAITASLVQAPSMVGLVSGFAPIPAAVSVIIGLILSAGIGALIGFTIATTNVPAFIATLGAQLIFRALAKMYTSSPVSNLSDSFRWLAKGKLFGFIPMIIVIFILVFIISAFLLTQTRFGKNVYAIGGNDQAARVAGINVKKNIILIYTWCSLCAGIGGILLASRTGSSDPSTSGLNYELDAIAAATIGGTSHSGGICRVTGVLAGVLILGVINNGLVLLSVNDNLTNIIKGLIIVGAVAIDMRKNNRKS